MKVVYNKIIPFPGFLAINLFGICFVREEYKDKISEKRMQTVLNHESIHTEQMKELAYIFFYLWYFIEWLVRLFINGPSEAYENISFEQEAYEHEAEPDYLKERKRYCWLKKYKKN